MNETVITPGDLTFVKDKELSIKDLIGKTIKNIQAIERYTNDRVVVSCEDGTLFLLSSVGIPNYEGYSEGSDLELRKIKKIRSEKERKADIEEERKNRILYEIKDLENSKKRYLNIDKKIEELKQKLKK